MSEFRLEIDIHFSSLWLEAAAAVGVGSRQREKGIITPLAPGYPHHHATHC